MRRIFLIGLCCSSSAFGALSVTVNGSYVNLTNTTSALSYVNFSLSDASSGATLSTYKGYVGGYYSGSMFNLNNVGGNALAVGRYIVKDLTGVLADVSVGWDGSFAILSPFSTELELSFSAEWAGKLVELKGTNGVVVFSNVVGTNGSIFSFSTMTSGGFWAGDVYVDGVKMGGVTNNASWSTNTNTGTPIASGSLDSGSGGPYDYSFDSTYSATQWQLARADGTVVASGQVGDYGSFAAGYASLLPGQTASLQLNTAKVYDEMGMPTGYTGFQDTGYVVTGNSGESSSVSFVNNTNSWSPTFNIATSTNSVEVSSFSLATNSVSSSVSTNLVSNTVTSVVVSSNIVTTNIVTTSTDDVSVDVGSVEAEVSDDGEDDAISAATGLLSSIKEGVANMDEGFDNLSDLYSEIQNDMPTSVGHSCTLTIGEFSVDLSVIGSSGIRTGLKYLVLLFAVHGFVVLLREAIA